MGLKWRWCWLDLEDLEGAKESVRIISTLRAFANFRARLYMVNACYDVYPHEGCTKFGDVQYLAPWDGSARSGIMV